MSHQDHEDYSRRMQDYYKQQDSIVVWRATGNDDSAVTENLGASQPGVSHEQYNEALGMSERLINQRVSLTEQSNRLQKKCDRLQKKADKLADLLRSVCRAWDDGANMPEVVKKWWYKHDMMAKKDGSA